MKTTFSRVVLLALGIAASGALLLSNALPALAATHTFIITFQSNFRPAEAELDSASQQVADNASPAVVMINGYQDVPVYNRRTRKQIGTTEARVISGSGFFVTSDGYIITNRHVVSDESMTYKIYDGENTIPAQVVYRDPDYDLAILKVDGTNYPTIPLDTKTVQIGEQVISVGNALGKIVDSVSAGVVSDENQNVNAKTDDNTVEHLKGLIQTTAPIYPGDSGSPLLDSDGKVIGVNVAGSTSGRASYSIPVSVLETVLSRANITA